LATLSAADFTLLALSAQKLPAWIKDQSRCRNRHQQHNTSWQKDPPGMTYSAVFFHCFLTIINA